MEPLPVADVEQIVNLVARAGDPTTIELSLPERKRMLLEGVAEIVDADTWIWSNVTLSRTVETDVMTTSLIDGGYRDERERAAFYELLSYAEASKVININVFNSVRQGRFVTLVRSE